MERISIVAEAAERVSNRSKGKGLLEGLPQDYWDFVPSENKQVQSNMTKIILSPYQVIFFFSHSSLVKAVPCWLPV
jgi:DNA-directed RNA polymerase-4 subunit 1